MAGKRRIKWLMWPAVNIKELPEHLNVLGMDGDIMVESHIKRYSFQ
jgi:hypothetical protein